MSNNKETSLQKGWPEARQFRKSIRLEFSLYVSGLILILMLITGYVVTGQYVDTVTRNVVDNLLVQARSYSGSAGKLIISTNGPDALLLNNICKKLTADNSDIYWAGIADNNNAFLAHTDIRQVMASASLHPISSDAYHNLIMSGETFSRKNDTIHITVPIVENQILIGRLGVASSSARIATAKRTSITTVASIGVVVLLVGLPLTMVLLHRKLKPISVITDHLKKVDPGDFRINIPFKRANEFGYLSEVLRVMGDKLNLARQQQVEQERITRELEIAREIQANILPRDYPQSTAFEFAGAYRSAREVGGDYYDFVEQDENHVGFLVADVSGKSLPGMLVMLLTRDIVIRHSRMATEPAQILSAVNRELLGNIKQGMFVTMFFGVINQLTGELRFASAGHNPLIVLNKSDNKPKIIKTRGFPLGLMAPNDFEQRIESGSVMLAPDDWIIQYTDGINEAQDKAGVEFGMERFTDSLITHRNLKPGELVEQTLKQLDGFVGDSPQFDDITILTMKWMGINADKQQYRKVEAIHAG